LSLAILARKAMLGPARWRGLLSPVDGQSTCHGAAIKVRFKIAALKFFIPV
jgi:hypothetical protein